MSLPIRGTVVLESLHASGADVTLTSDPAEYRVVWPRRFTTHEGIEAFTLQTFRSMPGDARVTLRSGDNQYLNLAEVQQLDTNARIRAATFRLTDSEGNDFTVFIERFDPVLRFAQLYSYEMDLRVLAIAALRGVVYTEA